MERVPERVLEVGVQDRFDLMGRDMRGDLLGGLGRDPLFRLFGLNAGGRSPNAARSSSPFGVMNSARYSFPRSVNSRSTPTESTGFPPTEVQKQVV